MSTNSGVLVIDDETINLKVISDILRDDTQLILAKSGEQGIRKAAEFMPDLILLDVVMPQMDGFETLKILRNDPKTCHIPVIFITALDDSSSEEKGLSSGAADYIQKPLKPAIVRARVKLHLELAKKRMLLEKLANVDPLTSIANRRKYEEVAANQWHELLTTKGYLSLAVIDIDNFKQYNDSNGHAAGDEIIRKVADVLSYEFSGEDELVARYGGEEFVVILPNIDQQGAYEKLDRCVMSIRELALPHPSGGVVTISVGGATMPPTPNAHLDQLFLSSDELLYQAKKAGKNRVLWKKSVVAHAC
ncbi:diguanylate cyclase [Marinomonas mediterranea]|uniref:GGDEF domain-containing response regulator n=1 Tax=Marinomonas mediterranea TaxID=119864 RepID=UPI0023490953|nr:diguanylate cyclase [Marinomonas mediterranea]WCN10919.1 diguanylate cyclase [Marinomonas mediterranea]WCN14981.1 diguanylate cyclase [Marinomonas mediterranea]